MTDIDAPQKARKADSLPAAENRLLKATHNLAATIGVEPQHVIRALASVVQRRVDFERLRRTADGV